MLCGTVGCCSGSMLRGLGEDVYELEGQRKHALIVSCGAAPVHTPAFSTGDPFPFHSVLRSRGQTESRLPYYLGVEEDRFWLERMLHLSVQGYVDAVAKEWVLPRCCRVQ